MAESQTKSGSWMGDFGNELAQCWQQLPDKGLFFALVVVWSSLFQFWGNAVFGWVDTPSLFGWMYWVFDRNPDDGHGKLVPLVVLALFWWKRRELLNLPRSIWWPSFGLVVLGLFMHLLGFMVQQTRVSIVGYFVGLYGLIGLVWGAAWLRATFFPMFLFAFCVPLGTLSEPITFPLRMLVAKICTGFANTVLAIDVSRQGTAIFSSDGTGFDVEAACSGIRSLLSLLALTTIYGFITFKSNWRRLLMMLAAVPLAILGNVARITGAIIVWDAFGHKWGALVEQKLGFLTFSVAIVGMLVLGYCLREQSRANVPPLTGPHAA